MTFSSLACLLSPLLPQCQQTQAWPCYHGQALQYLVGPFVLKVDASVSLSNALCKTQALQHTVSTARVVSSRFTPGRVCVVCSGRSCGWRLRQQRSGSAPLPPRLWPITGGTWRGTCLYRTAWASCRGAAGTSVACCICMCHNQIHQYNS